MLPKSIVAAVLFAATSIAEFKQVAAEERDGAKPNILLILADDVGFSDYGCFGGEIATPHIDRLAAEGLCFTQFYNNAVCVPTRYSLLTGLYPRYVRADHRIGLSPEVVSLAEVLGAAGYHTSLSGKWHLGSQAKHRPIDRGFAEYYGLAGGCCNHFDPAQRDPEFEGGTFRQWMHNDRFIKEFPADFYSTDAITDHACRQIRQSVAAGKPFFAHVCYTAAHSPLHAKPEQIAKYAGKYVAGWDEMRRRRHQRQIKLGLIDPQWILPPREPEFPAWNEEPLQEWNEHLMAVYAAMVDGMDEGIGELLRTVDELGRRDDTIVILLNDNGGCAEQAGGDDPTNIAGPKQHYVSCGAGWASVQNTPFRRYKSWAHEGGISTPLVVRWPKVVKAGSKTNQLGHVIDLMPTLVEAAGARYLDSREGQPAPRPEGRSLLPILRGGEVAEPESLYWAALDNRAIRQGKWKLVWDQNVGRWELYDIIADRTEMRDLAAQESVRFADMATLWQAWAERTGAVHQLGIKQVLKPK